MRVSIAMATYNGEKYLQEQLDSFLNQTRLPDELVVSDDHSTDQTLSIIEEFASKAPFEVTIHINDNNIGHFKNFQQAIKLTSGDIILLSDQDDIWMPQKIETLEKVFISCDDIDVLQNDVFIMYGDKSIHYQKLSQASSFLLGSRSKFVLGCAMSFRKEFKHNILPFPEEGVCHDRWIYFCGQVLGKLHFLDKPLQFYRRHQNNATVAPLYQPSIASLIALLLDKEKNRLATLNALTEKLHYIDHFVSINTSNPSNHRILEYLNIYRDTVLTRINILNEINIKRKVKAAINFYLKGGYGYFSNFRTLIKDLVFV